MFQLRNPSAAGAVPFSEDCGVEKESPLECVLVEIEGRGGTHVGFVPRPGSDDVVGQDSRDAVAYLERLFLIAVCGEPVGQHGMCVDPDWAPPFGIGVYDIRVRIEWVLGASAADAVPGPHANR